jgi:hypothetical protein
MVLAGANLLHGRFAVHVARGLLVCSRDIQALDELPAGVPLCPISCAIGAPPQVLLLGNAAAPVATVYRPPLLSRTMVVGRVPRACGGVLCSARFGALPTDRDMLQPMLQRHVIRVLWMVPIYSIDACLSLTMPTRFEAYSEGVRELYEVRRVLARAALSRVIHCALS